MDAAKFVAANSDGPDLLAAYIILRRFAYGEGRNQTAAGAKAIRKLTGVSDYRSKRLLGELLELRYSEGHMIGSTGRMLSKASIYSFPPSVGDVAYLPSLFTDRHATGEAMLRRILDSAHSAGRQRDALLLLLHVYASTDYGEGPGAVADRCPYQEWCDQGECQIDELTVSLGPVGRVGDVVLHAVSAPDDDDWEFPISTAGPLLASDPDVERERLSLALDCLLQLRALSKAVVVTVGREQYLLWIFNPAYRQSLDGFGVRTDLAKDFFRLAQRIGADPLNELYGFARESEDGRGSGVFFCGTGGRTPVVRTLLLPRFHAPTPVNLSGIHEVAKVTSGWAHDIERARTTGHAHLPA